MEQVTANGIESREPVLVSKQQAAEVLEAYRCGVGGCQRFMDIRLFHCPSGQQPEFSSLPD